MSLITQCPACATMFRVVPDQLRISEGWVRCGQCEEVFDANAHLQTLDESALQPTHLNQPQTVDEPAEPPVTMDWMAPEAPAPAGAYDWGSILQPPPMPSTAPAEYLTQAWQASPPDNTTNPVEEPYIDPLAAPLEEDVPPQSPEHDAFLQEVPHDLRVSDEIMTVQPEAEHADGWLQHAPAFQVPISESSAQDVDLEADHAPPSFMASASNSVAARPWLGKKVLLTLCVLMTLLLALQYVMLQRDRVAATVPALRPLLVDICNLLTCSISAPQQIESISIESSAFTSLRTGVYVLSVGLKNTAVTDLATPALELTLTDLQDRAIFRRVLLPSQWVGKPQIAASSELGASVPISVHSDVVTAKIAGYKLLAFYP
jgi:predicted Zn finger-like uncharacterized protein